MKSVYCAALVGAIALPWAIAKADTNPWGAGYFPNLPVVTQDGKTLSFYDDMIKGKRVMVSFVYTNCPDICPLTTALLAQVGDQLGDMVKRDIFFITITVDPEHDTPAKMKAFAKAFGARPGWQFVTGCPENVRAIARALGDRSRALYEHRNEVILGNEATGEWMRNSLFGDIGAVLMDIRAMDPKWRDQVHVPAKNAAASTSYTVDNQPGQVLFKRLCAPCHTIGVGNRVGPDLRGVTKRRNSEWLTSFIMRPDEMRAKKDPAAMALVKQFEGVRMPKLGISKLDAADLINYLQARDAMLDAGESVISAADHTQHAGPSATGSEHRQHIMAAKPAIDHSQH